MLRRRLWLYLHRSACQCSNDAILSTPQPQSKQRNLDSLRTWNSCLSWRTSMQQEPGCKRTRNDAHCAVISARDYKSDYERQIMCVSRYCTIRYGQAVKHIPLEMAAAAPPAQVSLLIIFSAFCRCELFTAQAHHLFQA